MALLVISAPGEIAHEAPLINELFLSGLQILHLRKPGYDEAKLKSLLNHIDQQYYNRIALHQHHEIAAEFGMHRLHYTETARNQSGEKQWLQKVEKGYLLSTSIHDITLLPALKWFDYVFFGPVFNSISKPGYESKLPAGFKVEKIGDKPRVIALGGVEVNNLNKVRVMNFDGAAVLGTIWNEPKNAVKKFNELIITLSK